MKEILILQDDRGLASIGSTFLGQDFGFEKALVFGKAIKILF